MEVLRVKKKYNPKMTFQSQREFYAALFGDEACTADQNVTLQEIEQSIADCIAMIYDSIDQGDKEEIAFWRKMLQENKVQRRKMLTA